MFDKDYFVVVQSIVDSNVKIKVKANRLIRFNYDERCGQSPIQIQAEDKRHAVVLEVKDYNFSGGKETVYR